MHYQPVISTIHCVHQVHVHHVHIRQEQAHEFVFTCECDGLLICDFEQWLLDCVRLQEVYGMSMCSVWADVWPPTVFLSLAYISAGDACQRVNKTTNK